jgi:hypothetical protein
MGFLAGFAQSIEVFPQHLLRLIVQNSYSVKGGLVAAVAHHSLCTVYLRSDLLSAIVFWSASNALFAASVIILPPSEGVPVPSELPWSLLTFNGIYVRSPP